jgi:hypothetical protein
MTRPGMKHCSSSQQPWLLVCMGNVKQGVGHSVFQLIKADGLASPYGAHLQHTPPPGSAPASLWMLFVDAHQTNTVQNTTHQYVILQQAIKKLTG